jgi:hypothetical protein
MAKMFGCSDRTPRERSYRLRPGDQVPTRLVSIREIMQRPEFALGAADARAGRGYPRNYDTWGHTNDG